MHLMRHVVAFYEVAYFELAFGFVGWVSIISCAMFSNQERLFSHTSQTPPIMHLDRWDDIGVNLVGSAGMDVFGRAHAGSWTV